MCIRDRDDVQPSTSQLPADQMNMPSGEVLCEGVRLKIRPQIRLPQQAKPGHLPTLSYETISRTLEMTIVPIAVLVHVDLWNNLWLPKVRPTTTTFSHVTHHSPSSSLCWRRSCPFQATRRFTRLGLLFILLVEGDHGFSDQCGSRSGDPIMRVALRSILECTTPHRKRR